MAFPTRRTNDGFNLSSTSSVTINYPSDSVSGDLLILQFNISRSVAGAITPTLSGGASWKFIRSHDDSTSNGVYWAYYWCWRGSETSVTVSASPNTSILAVRGSILAYDGSTTSGIGTSQSAYSLTFNNSALSTPALVTTSAQSEIALFCGGSSSVSTLGVTWSSPATELNDRYTTGSTQNYLQSDAYHQQATSGSSQAYTITPSDNMAGKVIAGIEVIALIPAGDYTATYNSGTGSFTVPPGVSSVTSHVIGGGGPGTGTSTTGSATAWPGGAGAAYARKTFSVSKGDVLSYSVGAGGTGTTGAGSAGGTSWFKSNDANGCVAPGGAAATTSAAGAGSSTGAVGDVVRAGGSGSLNSGSTQSGAGGGAAGVEGAGGNASGTTAGTSGGTYAGSGGAGRTSNGNGNSGNAAGGGGSGAIAPFATSQSGGSGGAGVVVVAYTISYAVPKSVSETATFTDSAQISQASSDSTTLTDSAYASVNAPSSDSLTLTDSAHAGPNGTDAIVLSETNAQVAISAPDNVSLVESQSVTATANADAVSFTDNAFVSNGIQVSDSIVAVEDASVTTSVIKTASDSFTLTEADAAVSVVVVDVISAVDQVVQISNQVTVSDQIVATDNASVALTGSDAVVFSETAYANTRQPLNHPRAYRVRAVDRTHRPAFRARTTAIRGVDRTHTVTP